MTVRDRILDTALRMFRTYGIKSVTMFDISRECGISKKTVYEHFTDKAELVQEGIGTLLEMLTEQMSSARREAADAIDELMRTTRNIEVLGRTMNPVMLFEIQKYHPQAAQAIAQFKREGVLQHIRENLERGIAEGWYRSNLNMDIIARMRQLQLESAFDPSQYPAEQFDPHEVMQEITANYIMGIATLEGHKLAARYLQYKEENISTT
ncbi:TetR/AcrR family transcriptional regulator [Chitinophaga japonensis]|uniref:TetR family transcriptional regulator n=1 Tax=Chitinophaga japonensis TaxID=104662 RepID=A0A562TE95_CHIJA|nr:TetR/AcrR family transcriptional regulator [Chitinophaga japonensis]TWI91598.1 TetR family transcriptional regulator [Chitinophaga japonensis]